MRERFELLLRQYPEDDGAREEYAGVMYTAGEYSVAENQWSILSRRWPENITYLENHGDALLKERKYDRAAAVLKKARALAPRSHLIAIKLARAYALNRQLREASEVFDAIRPDLDLDARLVQELMAPLLLDINRPQAAEDTLEKLQLTRPDELQVLIWLARAKHQLYRQAELQETIERMAAVSPEDVESRIELATLLAMRADYGSAAVVYSQVLSLAPQNMAARIGIVESYIDSFDAVSASQAIATFLGGDQSPAAQRVIAKYHTLVGEYGLAKAILIRLLHDDPQDAASRLALGQCLADAGESAHALAQFRQITGDELIVRASRLATAETLAEERRFHESNDLMAALRASDPTDVYALLRMVKNYRQMRNPQRAIDLCLRELEHALLSPRAEMDIRVELGHALRELGHNMESLYEFQQVLTRTEGQSVPAIYGEFAALQRLGEPEAARQSLERRIGLLTPSPFLLVSLADLASADCNYQLAMEMLSQCANLAAQVRLAEIQALANCDCGASWHGVHTPGLQELVAHCTCKMGLFLTATEPEWASTFRSVLAISPTNIRARMGLARSLAACLRYRSAIAEYEQVLRVDPDYTVALRERARTFFDWRGWPDTGPAYDESQVAASVLVAPPAPANAIAGVGMAGISGANYGIPGGDYGLSAGYVDQQSSLSSTIAMESLAKSLKDWRAEQAIGAYHALIDVEPANQSAYFDLAQSYSKLKYTSDAIATYEKLLAINPCHREASIAHNTMNWRLHPHVHSAYDVFDQTGREGLTDITRSTWSMMAMQPFGNENDLVGIGYSGVLMTPKDGSPNLGGNVLNLRYRNEYLNRLLIRADLNVEEYDDRVSTRPTGDLVLGLRFPNDGLLFCRGTVSNVLENGESLRQDIYRYGFEVGYEGQPMRDWWLRSTYQLMQFSDSNLQQSFAIRNAYRIHRTPRQLMVHLDYDFTNFNEFTVFDPVNGLFGAVHPYFAPQSFSQVTSFVEWRQTLNRDLFVGAREWWYSLRYGVRFDSESEFYNLWSGEIHHDLKPWLSLQAGCNFIRSGSYDVSAAYGSIVVRFP